MVELGTFDTLRATLEGNLARITFDHPPMNLLDGAMSADLARLVGVLEGLEDVAVAVFDSADRDFFIAHADVAMLVASKGPVPAPEEGGLPLIHALFERYRNLPMVTIACLGGIARGGGSEFALALDLRFGALGRTRVSQPEVAVGIIPGAGGTQRLTRLLGRARALEMVCGAEDLTAELAERYGYLNRALPADELQGFVADLAARIASFPAPVVRMAKAAVSAAEAPLTEGLVEEWRLFGEAMGRPEARQRMQAFLDRGGQTRAVETGPDPAF